MSLAPAALYTTLEAEFGLRLEPWQQAAVERALAEAPVPSPAELAARVAVGETYFFRHPEQLSAFADVVLDALGPTAARPLRVLSAGCATGEEAYTLALLARQRLGTRAMEAVSILGVDLSPAAIDHARRGRYGPNALRALPSPAYRALFRAQDGEAVLHAELAAGVSFDVRNLLADDPDFWAPGAFDVVFCRNVAIHLTASARRRLLARLVGCLAEGGYLFLAPAELPLATPVGLLRVAARGAVFFRRAGPGVREPRPADARTPRPGRSSLRLDPATAARLYAEERFDELLDRLGEQGRPTGAADELALLRAATLATRGRLGEAEAACRGLTERPLVAPDAHHLLARCREQASDQLGACWHDERAIAIDPAFAMPHMHLGLRAVRTGDPDGAGRWLARAAELLPREREMRLRLFGGGFGAAALATLCRAEAAMAGATP